MGIYISTMRKRKQVFRLPNGQRAEANLFSFAHRQNNSFFSNARRDRMEASMQAAAERAFKTYDGGYVIAGDLDNGVKSLDGAVVYDQVTKPSYADCYDFPGYAVGIIEVRGKRCYLVTERPWYKHNGNEEREYREVVGEGKHYTEGRFTNDHTPIIVGETVNEKGERIV